ncbi:MAG: hypothetical protein ABIY55_30500 [Kofleriaceae bacterium]
MMKTVRIVVLIGAAISVVVSLLWSLLTRMPSAARDRARKLLSSRRVYPIFAITRGVSVVAAAPVSSTSRASAVRPVGPTSASTRISSRSRTKELESLVINDQRGSNQRLGAAAGEPDRKTGILYVVVADWLEGSIMRGAVSDDARRPDLGALLLDPRDLDQTDELIGIRRADLRPR